MSKVLKEEILLEKNQVFSDNYNVNLVAACTIGEGVLRLDEKQVVEAITSFESLRSIPSFFIPASGSGSRMFQFLFEWVENHKNNTEVEHFFGLLPEMPFYNQLMAAGLLDMTDRSEVVRRMCSESGLNLATKPKGLIPFHIDEGKVYNAFQEHVRQAKDLMRNGCSVHFTIQQEFEKEIKSSIDQLGLDGISCSFSHQSLESNAFCFGLDGSLILDNEVPLKRPAGHGALLENLNALNSDIVLIKNIDNIQHTSKVNASSHVWKVATGLLLNFKADVIALIENFTEEAFRTFNQKYQLFLENELDTIDSSILEKIACRPSRVCGMVKNEGQPGGGPFWIKDGGEITKQIVEMSQIADNPKEKGIVGESTHFNPVFMAISKTDAYENRLDLNDFRDNSKYFVVKKSHMGEPILFRELPGLWNGSMSNWNTLFLEIPSAVFSPVKTVLDLMDSAHTS